MSQIKLLKINSFGTPEENAATDDVTFASYTVNVGGQVLSATGLDMNSTSVTNILDAVFADPTTGYINQTAGNLIINNIMAKERNNVMTTAGAVLFPTITDTAGQVDSFKIPDISGPPTATPAFSSSAGYMAYDSSNKNMYVWDGASWENLNIVTEAAQLVDSYIAEVNVAANDAVYISSADNVSPAKADTQVHSQAIGFASAAALAAAPVQVVNGGVLSGFTGLTAGSRYFLDPSTAGAITATVPSASGQTVMSVGYAKDATTLHIQFQNMGKRS